MSDEIETKELVFAPTKEHLREGLFCDACRKYRFIGICHGIPGVGKTRSAREYARWDVLSQFFPEELFTLVGRRHLDDQFPHKPFATPGSPAFTELAPCRTIYYTAPVTASAFRIEREVMALQTTRWLLQERWGHLGMHLRVDDFTDAEATFCHRTDYRGQLSRHSSLAHGDSRELCRLTTCAPSPKRWWKKPERDWSWGKLERMSCLVNVR